MVNFSVDEIREMMGHPHNLRNISVIAHVDHGKSTLSDSLVGYAGLIAKANVGDSRYMDTRPDEQERGVTIKSTAVTLHFELEETQLKFLNEERLHREKCIEQEAIDAKNREVEAAKRALKDSDKKGKKDKKDKKSDKKDKKSEKVQEQEMTQDEKEAEEARMEQMLRMKKLGKIDLYAEETKARRQNKAGTWKVPFLINLIDCPGHVDFSSEVTAALRVTDGAIVVVDCIEGVCVQTETVLRQAISERIRPVLFMNKLDRVFLELMMDPEEAYQTFSRAIESVNVVIAMYKDDLLGEIEVFPNHGTVGFGSGLHAWAFTIGNFAQLYSAKFDVPYGEMMESLWGDVYFDPARGKFIKDSKSKNGDSLERTFCQLILEPIGTLFKAVMDNKVEVYTPILQKLEVKIPSSAKDMVGKPLLKEIMREWLPSAECLLRMIVTHLPSPVVSQRYRIENLYSGPMNDDIATAIRLCRPNGPMCVYISKMVPTSDKGRFYAFGRVFAGTISSGQEVRILGPDFIVGKKIDLFVKKVQRTVIMMGRSVEQVQDIPVGNTVGLVGVDQYLLKAGTITDHEECHPIVSMKYSVSPVVRTAVDVTNAADLPKLMEGLKRLAKSDPLVVCTTTPTGEHVIAAAGELHLEICIKDLRDDFMKGAPIKVSDPVVSFNETILGSSSQTVVTKSSNAHNRIYATSQPIAEELIKALDSGEISAEQETKQRARMLTETFKWDPEHARRIWSFGLPPDGLTNILVENTKGVQFMMEIKDHVNTAFQQASLAGVYCNEALRGFRLDINDVVMHADAIHRGAGQISPPTRDAIYGCQIVSNPALMEPMYLCDITVPETAVSGVYTTLSARRGQVDAKIDRPGTPLTQVRAFLPVLESFGFTQLLRQNTSGKAFPQMLFSHYAVLQSDIKEAGSMTYNLALKVRARKGLKAEMPAIGDFHVRL